MGSLSGCAAKAGFHPSEIEEFRKAADAYRAQGMPIMEAQRKAVGDFARRHQEAIMAIEDQLPWKKEEAAYGRTRSNTPGGISGAGAGQQGENTSGASEAGPQVDTGKLDKGPRMAGDAGRAEAVGAREQYQAGGTARFSLKPDTPEFKRFVAGRQIIDLTDIPLLVNGGVPVGVGPGVYLAYRASDTGPGEDAISIYDPTRVSKTQGAMDEDGNGAFFFSGKPWANEWKGFSKANVKDMNGWLKKNPPSKAADFADTAEYQKSWNKWESGWNNFGTASGTILAPSWVKLDNPFEFWNDKHLDLLDLVLRAGEFKEFAKLDLPTRASIKRGSYPQIENKSIQSALKAAGFDGMFVTEEAADLPVSDHISQLNIAVFSSSQIKSQTGNVGSYGQRPVTEEEASRLGMTADRANALQAQGDVRFSVKADFGRSDVEKEPRTVSATSREEIGISTTKSLAFQRWFSGSKVVDSEGNPLVVYRGEHGEYNDRLNFQSKMKSISFGDRETANEYAMSPNDRGDVPINPRVMPSYLNIKNPITSESPFLDFADIIPVIGRDNAILIAKKFADHIEGGTSNWEENFAPIYGYGKTNKVLEEWIKPKPVKTGGVITLLNESPESINELYVDLYPVLDDPEMVSLFERYGYDGAIHIGNGVSGSEYEYRIFNEDTQAKSATGNNGQYDSSSPDTRFAMQGTPRTPTIDLSRYTSSSRSLAGSNLTANQIEALRRVGGIVDRVPISERIANMKNGDWGMKLKQGLVDQYAPIAELDEKAYILSRLSNGTDGAVEALMMYGNLTLLDGVYDSKAGGQSFIQSMQKLQGEQERFLWWVAANRAEKLTQEERENLFDIQDIAALKKMSNGVMEDGKSRTMVYAQALSDLNKVNRNVLDMASESGIIDKDSRQFWEDQFYIPFYRAMEDGISGPNLASNSSLAKQYAFKKLKGGDEKLNQDLMANMLMNWSHLLSAAAKNRAAVSTLDAAVKIGAASKTGSTSGDTYVLGYTERLIPKGKAYTDDGVDKISDGTAKIKEHGKVHYAVSDPLLLGALSSLEYTGLKGYKYAQSFKRMLTIGVTANPTFKIRNLIRDTLSVVATNPASYNVFDNALGGLKRMSNKDSQLYASALASGGIIRFGTMLEGNSSGHLQKLINNGIKENTIVTKWEHVKDKFQIALDGYNELGDMSEGANRITLYEKLIKEGKSHAEAAYAARDTLDFSMGGSYAAVRLLTGLVPFMNARMQGLYKLGRGFNQDKGRFIAVAGSVALASVALMLAYKDDDDWKKREDWDRDNYWWFKVGGIAYRIPKPFEVGVVGTMAERMVELMVSDEMTGERFRERMQHLVLNTFSMNPIPQIVKPVMEVITDYSFFTGREIEGRSLERLPKSERYNERSSEIAKLVGKSGIISPVQIDHLMNGYFGWLATMTNTVADFGIRQLYDAPPRPEMQLRDVFLAGNFVETLPSGSSRYVSQLYKQSMEIEQSFAKYRDLVKSGRDEEAAVYADKHGSELSLHETVGAVRQEIGELNSAQKRITGSMDLTPEQKRILLDDIAAAKNRIAKAVYPALNNK